MDKIVWKDFTNSHIDLISVNVKYKTLFESDSLYPAEWTHRKFIQFPKWHKPHNKSSTMGNSQKRSRNDKSSPSGNDQPRAGAQN